MVAFAKVVVIVFRRRDLFPLFCVVIKKRIPRHKPRDAYIKGQMFFVL